MPAVVHSLGSLKVQTSSNGVPCGKLRTRQHRQAPRWSWSDAQLAEDVGTHPRYKHQPKPGDILPSSEQAKRSGQSIKHAHVLWQPVVVR